MLIQLVLSRKLYSHSHSAIYYIQILVSASLYMNAGSDNHTITFTCNKRFGLVDGSQRQWREMKQYLEFGRSC